MPLAPVTLPAAAQKYKLATLQKELAEDPSYYFVMENFYNYGYTYMPLYVPEGFFYVRQILVADEETANTVLEKIEAGEDLNISWENAVF